VHRRLEALEARAKEFDKVLADKTKQAEDLASRDLEDAQEAFRKQVDAVQAHTEWDERTKEIQLANIQRVAQRRLDVRKLAIEDKKLTEIREGKGESERQIRGIRNVVRFAAAVIPPLPPLILGLLVWIRRRTLENLGANPKRLVYDNRPGASGPSSKSQNSPAT
jgi:ABC-2 type transport system permease protein